jgi:hypothetical protein
MNEIKYDISGEHAEQVCRWEDLSKKNNDVNRCVLTLFVSFFYQMSQSKENESSDEN